MCHRRLLRSSSRQRTEARLLPWIVLARRTVIHSFDPRLRHEPSACDGDSRVVESCAGPDALAGDVHLVTVRTDGERVGVIWARGNRPIVIRPAQAKKTIREEGPCPVEQTVLLRRHVKIISPCR